MSFDDDFAADELPALYDAFGVDGTARRGADVATPVRIIVDRDQQRLGEYGTTIGVMDTVSFMRAQWEPQQGDVIEWTDRRGAHSKRVESKLRDDGLEAVVVLHG